MVLGIDNEKTAAINYFGSSTKLAEALGLNKSAISHWGEDVPELRAFQIQQLTGGKLTVNSFKAIQSAPLNNPEVSTGL